MRKVALKKIAAVSVAVAPGAIAATAVGGSGGTEFSAIVTQMTDWLEGGLGQVLALGALSVGLGIGVVQQSVMAVVVGIAMAIAVFYGPGILTATISAALPL